MKTIFKVGDRVFDFLHGWGEVKEIQKDGTHVIKVDFDNYSSNYTRDGKDYHTDLSPILSFTEYNLIDGGFSQERKINYHDYVGKWGKFSNSEEDIIVISKLQEYNPNTNSPSGKLFKEIAFDKEFYYFEPLTESELCKLNLNGTDI